jgi:ferric-dicitrate binding protein FerR (iron transport regulator)
MGHQAVVLAAGDVGRVSDSTATAKTVDDVAAYAAWTQGELTFHETPVLDVLATVSHWYGIDFQLADTTLASGAVTATLHGETTAEVLALLRTLLNATMTFNVHNGRQVVVLHAQHRAQGAPVKTQPAVQNMFSNHSMEVGR